MSNANRITLTLSLMGVALLLISSGEAFSASVNAKGCIVCHAVRLDRNHSLACTTCHRGNDSTGEKSEAHANLIAQPAHPEAMAATCGPCHPRQVDGIGAASHFTLKNLVNLVRRAFGATTDLQSMVEIPESDSPRDALALADDLLRRRCLRCHLYYKGDDYPAVTHGTGCAACHLEFQNGRLASHAFLAAPGDRQCLSCHYGNRVGFDFHGRFEHDLNVEYRTPYTTKDEHFRPFGVEYHELAADIHQQRGLVCIDCHPGSQLMAAGKPGPSCADCHDADLLDKNLPDRVRKSGPGYIFLAGTERKQHTLPIMTDPAHATHGGKISCQVCHAQWSFADSGKHLLRSDYDEFDQWDRLTTQGSSEVTKLLENNIDFSKNEIIPAMKDKIYFRDRPGVWYKGYGMRRWETIFLEKNEKGEISVVRPLLDYFLSWQDGNGLVHIDSHPSEAGNNGLHRYTPHTTGKAGLFYRQRLENLHFAEAAKENKQGD
ncbi:hypothetical protein JT06_03910 [Desulfobulbus sp. Tol-SR]|nr:hypothetical protein JT06_03910 [Desulfobulbus sp. Tol-SR]